MPPQATAPAPARANGAQAAPQQSPSLLDAKLAGAITTLDNTAEKYAAVLARSTISRLERSMLTADALEIMRAQIAPAMPRLMKLMNSELGFVTDKRPEKGDKPYPDEVVREAVIVGLLRGVYPFNNEMNIIAGRCYVTQEGYRRKVREIPGLTELVITPGIPRAAEGQTVVRMAVSWKLHGKPGQLLDHEGKVGLPIAVPVHSSTGVDAIIGKAIRKALKRVYEQITGSIQEEADEDAALLPPPSPEFQSQDPPRAIEQQQDADGLIDDLGELVKQADTQQQAAAVRQKIDDAEGTIGHLAAEQLRAALAAKARPRK